jgi:hypothetical protein
MERTFDCINLDYAKNSRIIIIYARKHIHVIASFEHFKIHQNMAMLLQARRVLTQTLPRYNSKSPQTFVKLLGSTHGLHDNVTKRKLFNPNETSGKVITCNGKYCNLVCDLMIRICFIDSFMSSVVMVIKLPLSVVRDNLFLWKRFESIPQRRWRSESRSSTLQSAIPI